MYSLEAAGRKADITCLGKALSGGTMPVSAMFADSHIMNVLRKGDHGSTFGGSPLGMAVARTSIEVLIEEKIVENSFEMGEYMRALFRKIKSPLIKDVRG